MPVTPVRERFPAFSLEKMQFRNNLLKGIAVFKQNITFEFEKSAIAKAVVLFLVRKPGLCYK